MKKSLPAWLILTVICVVAAALLAGTNLLTKDVIAANAFREKYETLGKLMPEATDFEETESGVVIGKDGTGAPVGYSLAATTQGFGGEVETTVAARPDGTINGISVGGANFAETAGLGARAKEPEFQEQFAGKAAPVALTKDGGEIEALSGATITSRAVIKGVNEAMEKIAAEAGFTMEAAAASTNAGGFASEHLGENKYAASADGFGGPVKVYLTLDEARAIQEISIGDENFSETDGLGARAKEAAFQDQFIGKTIPVAIGDIDALTGATITTNAVLEAIGKISTDLDNGLADAPITEEAAAETAPAAEDKAETSSTAGTASVRRRSSSASSSSTTQTSGTEDAAGAGNTKIAAGKYDAVAQGFVGPVHVYLTIDEEGKIAEISIGDADFAETTGLGALALEEDFQKQFIGKTIPVAAGDIDAITAATYTTNAVLEAIEKISTGAGNTDTGAAAGETAAAETPKPVEKVKIPAGKYDAVGQGFVGPVHVYLTVDEEGKIAEISIGDEDFAETDIMGGLALGEDFQKQFIGLGIPVGLEEVDVITNATHTTEGVLEAIQKIVDANQ